MSNMMVIYLVPALGWADFSMTSIQAASRFNDDNDPRRESMGLESAGAGLEASFVPWPLCAPTAHFPHW